MMKRSTLKLEIRRETLRVLVDLELAHVVGGAEGAQADTGNAGTGCPFVRFALDTDDPARGCVNVKL
jgi:hypothetical protein